MMCYNSKFNYLTVSQVGFVCVCAALIEPLRFVAKKNNGLGIR